MDSRMLFILSIASSGLQRCLVSRRNQPRFENEPKKACHLRASHDFFILGLVANASGWEIGEGVGLCIAGRNLHLPCNETLHAVDG